MSTTRQQIRGTSPVEEITGHPPSYLVRSGLSLLSMVFLLAMAGAWFISYPYIIPGQIVISSSNPPASMMAHVSGRIEKLFVAEGDQVRRGDLLALMEAGADLDAVLALSLELKQPFDPVAGEELQSRTDTLLSHQGESLGELSGAYSEYLMAAGNYRNFLDIDPYGTRIRALEKEISGIDDAINQLNRKEQLFREKLLLATSRFRRDSTLYSKKVLADLEYEQSREALLTEQIALEQIRLEKSSRIIDRSARMQMLADYTAAGEEERRNLAGVVESARFALLGEVDEWLLKFVIVSPLDGRVTMPEYWAENQIIADGATIMTIVPEGEQTVRGRMQIAPRGSGKVAPGQKVLIKLDGYPYLEYGIVEGRVAGISLAATESGYSVDIELPSGLVTTYGVDPLFYQNMSGVAEIVTDDMRLLERIVYPFRYLFSRNRVLKAG